MAADAMHGDARRDLVVAVVKLHAAGEHLRTMATTSSSSNGKRRCAWHMQRPVA